MVQPVIVPLYGIIAYPFSPVVIVEPAPSIVIPNEPDVDPGLKSPDVSANDAETIPFNWEPSPINEPVNEPVLYVCLNWSKSKYTVLFSGLTYKTP
jgi:hypothetical protein